jgi:hypothetical protein
MPVFQLTDRSGATYEINAPDEHAAVAALSQATGGPQQTEAPKAPESRGVMQTIDDYVRAAANGMTLGLADRIAAGAGAATGIAGKQGDYAGNLAGEQKRTDQFSEDHPVASIASNIAGGAVVPLGAMGAIAKGASLGAKTLYGMAAGAGLGATQGAISSKDLTDVPQTAREAIKGGVVGAGVGAVIPGAAKVIGKGYTAVADAIRGRADGMSRSATQHLVDALIADGPANVRANVERLGPEATLADAGPALLGKAQGASLNSDEGRSILQGALSARNEGTNARIAGEVDRALGPAEDPQTVTNAIRARRSEVDNQNYPRAFEQAPPVDTSELLVNLGPMISGSVGMERKALTNLRDMLMTEKQVPFVDPKTGARSMQAVPSPQTDAAVLHKIKGELDNVIEYDAPGLGIPAAALSRQQGALKHFRGQLNDALEQQVPGYQQANRTSAGLARRGEAVDQGTQYLGSGKTTPSPDRFAMEHAQREPGEQAAFAKGSRGNIDRVLGTKANDLQALRTELQGEGGWNTAKIATVHGQDAADRLTHTVDSNLKFRDTYNKVVENSQTAQRQAAASAMKPTPATQTPLINPNMSLTGLAASGTKQAVSSIVNTLMRRDPTKAYGEVAKVLSEQGGVRDARIQAIIDAIQKREGNAAAAPGVGNSAALIAAILANGYARSGPSRKQERR